MEEEEVTLHRPKKKEKQTNLVYTPETAQIEHVAPYREPYHPHATKISDTILRPQRTKTKTPTENLITEE